MSTDNPIASSGPASVPSSVLKGTGTSDYAELIMEPIGVELTTPDALRLLADVYERLKLGVAKPEALRLMMGNQELRIQHNTNVLVKANLKTNGTELWTIQADHEIRRSLNPDFTRYSY